MWWIFLWVDLFCFENKWVELFWFFVLKLWLVLLCVKVGFIFICCLFRCVDLNIYDFDEFDVKLNVGNLGLLGFVILVVLLKLVILIFLELFSNILLGMVVIFIM